MWIGDTLASVPDLLMPTALADVHVTVLSPLHLRLPLRLSVDGRPLERASSDALAGLLAENSAEARAAGD
jgi:hypothetical protein